jgi:hypothetical protein
MKPFLVGSVWALGFASVLPAGCSHSARGRTAGQPSQDQAYDPSGPEHRPAAQRLTRGEAASEESRTEERRPESRPDDAKAGGAIGGGPRESTFTLSNTAAILSVAAARCDREARCDRLGAGEKYDSRRDCLADIKRNERNDLSDDACPGGISPKGLDGCLQSIREEDCRNPLQTIGRLNACRTGNLCLR